MTEVMLFVAPVYTDAPPSTSRCPAPVVAGNVAVRVVAAAVSVAPTHWVSCGTGPDAGFTVRSRVVACVAEDPAPVIVTIAVPTGVKIDVLIVRVELCPELIDGGLNEADAPLGKPDALSPTLCAAPLVTVVVMVLVAD